MAGRNRINRKRLSGSRFLTDAAVLEYCEHLLAHYPRASKCYLWYVWNGSYHDPEHVPYVGEHCSRDERPVPLALAAERLRQIHERERLGQYYVALGRQRDGD